MSRAVSVLAVGLWLIAAPALAVDGRLPLAPAPRGDDGRFYNSPRVTPEAGLFLRLGFFARRVRASIAGRLGAATSVENDGAFLRANHARSVPTVTWVGHSTVLLQLGGVSLLTDPTWSDTASPVGFVGPRRYVAPGLAFEDLPPIDAVVISHNHYDHLDVGTLQRLAERNPATLFLVPLGNAALLREHGVENVEELDWGQSRSVGRVEIWCTPAQHWSRRGLTDAGRALWSSWGVVAPERRVYFGGDSGYFDGFARIGEALGPFDLAIVPIGAYEPQAMMRVFHLDPEQAIEAARDVRARRAMGVHWGTFDLSDEPLDEPPVRFRAAGAGAGLAEDDVWILAIGETREF